MTPIHTKPHSETSPPRLTLGIREWLVTLLLVLPIVMFAPFLWKNFEQYSTPPDYRLPYELSKDYGLYERAMDRLQPTQIPMLGDSVVWGEYVSRDGTLSHFLNNLSDESDRYVNAGVNGLFPIALEGLIRQYGGAIHNRKVILHYNLLWMSSPEADLSSPKEQKFNHPRLVPQFTTKIPCYRASFNDRASIVVTREIPFFSWNGHIRNTYFEQKNLHSWTLADDGGYPPSYPNAMAAPWKQITFQIPGEPENDPGRGLNSPRHKAWSSTGVGTQQFEWVPPEQALQQQAFRHLVNLLCERGNDVFVIIGPFNTHIMAPENLSGFTAGLAAIRDWLDAQEIPNLPCATLESALYGDASHPLTEGYRQLASEIWSSSQFHDWLVRH